MQYIFDEEARRRAATAGDVDAAANLGVDLALGGRIGEAVRYLRQAAAGGDIPAAAVVGILLLDMFDEPIEALSWLRRAADGGNVYAMVLMFVSLTEDNQPDEARIWFDRAAAAAAAADAEPLAAIAMAMERLGREDEAARWYDRAEEADGVSLENISDEASHPDRVPMIADELYAMQYLRSHPGPSPGSP